jgi:cation:H+ antiporter
MTIALIIIGFILLFAGGELLVRNAVQLAVHSRMSKMAIGAIVIGFSTSSPELVTSVVAAIKGSGDLAIGNVVGSNLVNISLFAGIAALITPLATSKELFRRDAPLVVVSSLTLMPLLITGVFSRLSGFIFVALLLFYIVALLRARVSSDEVDLSLPAAKSPLRALAGSGLSAALLLAGATALTSGAMRLASTLGISEQVIGLTIVAVGTGLPELAASIAAARKGQTDLVIGNLLGSNIFNVWGVLGLSMLARPLRIEEEAMMNDFSVMLGITLGSLLVLRSRFQINRLEGLLLVGAYLYYLAFVLA